MTGDEAARTTRRRAALRGDWLVLRVELLNERLRSTPAGDPAARVAELERLEGLLAGQHADFLADVEATFHLDPAEALLFECLAAVELPGQACGALLEFGGKIVGTTNRVVVDALLAAIAGGDPDVATALLGRLGPDGRLRRHALVDVEDDRRPRRLAPIHLGAGMLEHLVGRLPAASGARWLMGAPAWGDLYPAIVDVVATAFSLPATERSMVVLVGPSGSGRAAIVRAAAHRLERPVLRFDAEQLLQSGDVDGVARLGRDARLGGGVLLAADLATDVPPNQLGARRKALLHALAQVPAPLAFTADGDDPLLASLDRPLVRLNVGLPDEEIRTRLWSSALAPDEVAPIARTFALGPRAIGHAAATARVLAVARTGDPEGRASASDARQAIRAVVIASGVAQTYGAESAYRPVIDDLVLSPENRELLEELVVRVRRRRRVLDEWNFRSVVGPSVGIAALFHGPPGTGKSMAAHAVATHLGIECFRIDLSQVVSKWVGETEKHLGRVFDTAERSDALLLFDEADALFTKRTDVKSSNDRYANLEVNYLLQRIESFPGLAVLTTNHIAALDTAFMRRLSVQVRFDFPDEKEREILWRRKLPPEAPLDPDVALHELAEQYAMTGARIRNAALRAAFYAAEAGTPITQHFLEKAVLAEYKGAGSTPGATINLE